jgi:hypothetical protein
LVDAILTPTREPSLLTSQIQQGLGHLHAESVLTQLGRWLADYDIQVPYAALGMRSPADYRAEVTLSSSR